MAYLISQLFGVRATQFLLRLRSSTLFEWMLLFVTFALGTVFLVLHELRVSSGVPYFLKWVASWVGQADGGVGWQQLVFPLCLALRAVHLLFDFFRPDIHAVLVWLRRLLRHDVADSLEQHNPRSRLWWVLALDIVLLSGNVVALLLVFPWSDFALRKDFHLTEMQWIVRVLFTLTVRLLLSFLLWWFVPVVTWTRLHHQAPCDGADGVTHVDVGNLKAGGWPVDKQRIFVRPQVAGQWRRLQGLLVDENHSTLKVEGPPGTGKSTVAWAWACYMARQQSVVWVHCDRSDDNVITLLGGGCVSFWTVKPTQVKFLVDIAEPIALWAGATLLIVDGVTNETAPLLTSAAGWAKAVRGRRAVTVSSVQLVVKNHIARNLRLDDLTVFSWTREEYTAACADTQFWEQVKEILDWVVPSGRNEVDDRTANQVAEQPQFQRMTEEAYRVVLLNRKFAIAGYSARWMFFARTHELVGKTVKVCLQEVGDYSNLAHGLTGQRAQIAVNQLVAMFRSNGPFPDFQLVSRFVTRYVSERCELSFLTAAANANPNPAFDGWVFELEFLCRVRLAQTGHNNYVSIYEQRDGVAVELRLPVTQRVTFTNDLEPVNSCNIEDGTWFIPFMWNQGGYDAAMYIGRCLFFFQLTRNTTHTEKWTPMNVLASAVHDRLVQQRVAGGLQFVEHIYVLPPDRVGSFEFRSPQRIQSIPAWRDTHTRKVAFVRVAGGGNAPIATRNAVITPYGRALGQAGGRHPRQDNDDWRRNFPVRPAQRQQQQQPDDDDDDDDDEVD